VKEPRVTVAMGVRAGRVVGAAVLALAVAGCGSLFKATCAKPEDYAAVPDNPPLKIPAGLNAPDTRSAVPIPALKEPERPRSAAEPCIDKPPRFAEPKPPPPAA
jgi:uncharacterized lipoprotein